MTPANVNAESVTDWQEQNLAQAHSFRLARSTDLTRRIAVAFSIYAALRILVFAVAFPLFNNVDEKLHFMTIQMYAQGHLPGKELPHIDREFVKAFLPYWSPEYDHSQDFIAKNIPVRLNQLSAQEQQAALEQGYFKWKLDIVPRRLNFEAQGAPMYYIIAGVWYDIGQMLGIRDWRLAYWLRMINPFAYGFLVWLSYKYVSKIFPDRRFLQLAVPGLIAVFPQDVFFGMNRDVLPPVVWAAALLLMADAITPESQRGRSLILAAFLVGVSFLLEVSNSVLYAAMAATIWLWFRRSPARSIDKLKVVGSCAASAVFPPLLWMFRNYLVIGDLTGSKEKMRNFGWTVKPLGEMLHHPIFTWHGLTFFVVKLTRSVWHGDYDWHAIQMRSPAMDWFYVVSTLLLISVVVIELWRTRKTLPELQCWTLCQSLGLVFSSVLFILMISMLFDYHNHGYPSRLHPFFVSGRIISGALLPFALIYATGLEWVTTIVRRWIPPAAVLACLLLAITATEIHVRSVAFPSPYNFFALSRWER